MMQNEKKIKILFFYQYFGTPKGGWSTRVYELTRRWVEHGHEVTVVTSPYEKSDITCEKTVERKVIDGINLIIINFPDSNRYPKYKRIWNFLMFSLMSIWYALTERCDVIISSSGPITVGIPALAAKVLRGKKYIFEIRDLWPHGAIELGLLKKKLIIKIALTFEKLCYSFSEYVIAASPDMASFVRKRFPNVRNVDVISNASDNDLFGKEGNDELPEWIDNKKIILHFGSMGLIHNCVQLIEGAKELKDRGRTDFRMIFIGEGTEREMLEQKVKDYKLTNVKFLGLMPKVDLVKWVRRSVATVLTTLDNPVQNTCSPNKVFDSFSAGVPVIQTTTGWIKKFIDNEECGVNVKPNDAKSMADGILKILDDEKYRDKLAVNSQRVALEHFNRDLLASKYLEIIKSVVE